MAVLRGNGCVGQVTTDRTRDVGGGDTDCVCEARKNEGNDEKVAHVYAQGKKTIDKPRIMRYSITAVTAFLGELRPLRLGTATENFEDEPHNSALKKEVIQYGE